MQCPAVAARIHSAVLGCAAFALCSISRNTAAAADFCPHPHRLPHAFGGIPCSDALSKDDVHKGEKREGGRRSSTARGEEEILKSEYEKRFPQRFIYLHRVCIKQDVPALKKEENVNGRYTENEKEKYQQERHESWSRTPGIGPRRSSPILLQKPLVNFGLIPGASHLVRSFCTKATWYQYAKA